MSHKCFRGPVELALPALHLMNTVLSANSDVSSHLSQTVLKCEAARKGKHVPASYWSEIYSNSPNSFFLFGWKPLSKDDRKLILFPSLLAESYIYQV